MPSLSLANASSIPFGPFVAKGGCLDAKGYRSDSPRPLLAVLAEMRRSSAEGDALDRLATARTRFAGLVVDAMAMLKFSLAAFGIGVIAQRAAFVFDGGF